MANDSRLRYIPGQISFNVHLISPRKLTSVSLWPCFDGIFYSDFFRQSRQKIYVKGLSARFALILVVLRS